jgi:hypothetical protein
LAHLGRRIGSFWLNLARNKKGALIRKILKPLIFLVGRNGLETSANGLYLDGDLSQQQVRFILYP